MSRALRLCRTLTLIVCASFACTVLAQQRGNRIVSPEVGKDNKVTFRIQAPKATAVTVQGDWGSEKLTKDENGLWSVAVGPLTPDYYSYTFSVDGVKTLDPVNPTIKQGLSGN